MQAVLHWLGENVGAFLLALILAIAVWVTAVVAADPNEQRTLRPHTLEVIGQPAQLVIVNQVPGQVRLTLRAPRSRWTELEDNPGLVKTWIDLIGLEPGMHTVEVKSQVDISPIRYVAVEPRFVDVQLEPLVRREIPVHYVVRGELPLGYRSGAARLDPEMIVLSGAQSAVEAVNQARVELNISGAVDTITRTVPVEFLDSAGNPVSGLSASAKTVEVVQPVSLLGRFKNVAVKIVTTGQVANGYRLTNISVSPPTFTVFSENPELINEIPGFIETLPVDLTNLADDAAISVDLNLPQEITTVRDPSVVVQVSVAAIEGSMTLSLPLEVVGLEPGFQAMVSPDSVDVIVAGPLLVLDRLTPANFGVVVDVSGLPAGVYQREIVVDMAPEQVRIQTTLPDTVEVTIEIVPTVTATTTNLATTPGATLTLTPASTPTPTVHPSFTPIATR
ncbi:MAG: hypothetical protein IT297_04865 [Anaerolineae bacterium]|nr:hypothetical protein [Anaerolineae bacterium]